jgi:ATP-binding cassette subfamily B protein
MMPDVDGLGLIRRLRLKGVTVPAIALSAHHSPEARSASKLAGFDLHLAKPITPNELFDAICQVLP